MALGVTRNETTDTLPLYLSYLLLAYDDVYDIYEQASEVFREPYASTVSGLFDMRHFDGNLAILLTCHTRRARSSRARSESSGRTRAPFAVVGGCSPAKIPRDLLIVSTGVAVEVAPPQGQELDLRSPARVSIQHASGVAEKGASALLLPVSARRQLLDVSDEVATKVTFLLYSDAPDALVKALDE